MAALRVRRTSTTYVRYGRKPQAVRVAGSEEHARSPKRIGTPPCAACATYGTYHVATCVVPTGMASVAWESNHPLRRRLCWRRAWPRVEEREALIGSVHLVLVSVHVVRTALHPLPPFLAAFISLSLFLSPLLLAPEGKRLLRQRKSLL